MPGSLGSSHGRLLQRGLPSGQLRPGRTVLCMLLLLLLLLQVHLHMVLVLLMLVNTLHSAMGSGNHLQNLMAY